MTDTKIRSQSNPRSFCVFQAVSIPGRAGQLLLDSRFTGASTRDDGRAQNEADSVQRPGTPGSRYLTGSDRLPQPETRRQFGQG